MKNKIRSEFLQVSLISIFTLCFFTFVNGQYLLKSGGTSNIYELGNLSQAKIGVGIITPVAKLHTYSDIANGTAFKIETFKTYDGMITPYGSIEDFVLKNGQMYGVYQTSSSNSGIMNYFQDPVKIGKVLITKNANNEPTFFTEQNVQFINFVMNPTSGPVTYPLTVNGYGIRVRSNLVTDNFQLLTNPGNGKVLVSDNLGNGTWSNPAIFTNNYWQPCQLHSIYTAYDRVGIGTSNPSQMLEVTHADETGGIAINQTHERYTKSEIKFNLHGFEQWAVGSYLNETRPRSFFIWNQLLYKTALFISEENNIGIDTEWPAAKLHVNGNLHVKDRVGIGTTNPSQMLEVAHSDSTGGIAINQISNQYKKSEIKFNTRGAEKWAVGNDSVNGREFFFIWSHINRTTAFFIDGNNGMTGIGTAWPSAKLEVAGNFKATAIGIGINPPPSSDTYKLWVEGGIKARELKITIHDFADYCFEKDYKLMSIPDLEKFIKLNKHLPEIPTAKEIEDNDGLEIGEMQTKLVKKIEEQTLYIIDLHKQVDELRKQVELLTKK